MPVLKLLQKAHDTFDTATKQVTGLTAVDMSQTILFMGGVKIDDDGNRPSHCNLRGRLSGTTTIDYERDDSNGSVECAVSRYLVEFESGMSVQRASKTISSQTSNITITSVDTSKAFVLISVKTDGVTFGSGDFCRARLTSSTNLELKFSGTPTGGIVDWQVCEITDDLGSVQSGLVTLGSGTTLVNESITGVSRTTTFLIFSNNVSANTKPVDGGIRGQHNDGNNLRFDRTGSSTVINISYFAVTFTDGTTVEEVLFTMDTSTTSKAVAIASVDTARTSVHIPSTQRWGKNSQGTDDAFGRASTSVELTSSTNVQAVRGQSTGNTHQSVIHTVEWNDAPSLAAPVMDYNYRRRRV